MNTVTSVREQLEAQRRRAQGIGIAHAGVYLAAVVLVVLAGLSGLLIRAAKGGLKA